LLPIIAAIAAAGMTSPREIAPELERRGISTLRGGRRRVAPVSAILKYA
jgi:hypothetical protein